MSRFSRLFALFFGSFIGLSMHAPNAWAHPICSEIINVERTGSFLSRDTRVSYRIDEIWERFERPVDEWSPGYAFTKRSGLFLNINCDGGGPPVEFQEFFPIGLIVRPIMVLQLPPEGRFRSDEVFLLVQTEHGHLKVLRERDIQPLISGATYIFATSATQLFTCFRAEDCPGNQLVAPGEAEDRRICDGEQCDAKHPIASTFGYAVASLPNPEARSGPTPTARAFAAHSEINSLGPWQVSDATREAYCTPFPVRVFKPGGVLNDERGQSARAFTFCNEVAEGPSGALVRLVTKASAHARFERVDRNLHGAFFRRFGDESYAMTNVIDGLTNARLTGHKNCQVERTEHREFKASIGLSLEVAGGIVRFGGGAERRMANAVTEIMSRGEFIRFSSYIAPAFDGEPYSERLLLDLMFRAKCDESTVTKPMSVMVMHPAFEDGQLEISTQEMLVNRYASLVDETLPGYRATSASSRLRNGQFFEITDAVSYFYWKMVIDDVLRTSTLNDFVSLSFADTDDRELVFDFFTHLLLAAIFFYPEIG